MHSMKKHLSSLERRCFVITVGSRLFRREREDLGVTVWRLASSIAVDGSAEEGESEDEGKGVLKDE